MRRRQKVATTLGASAVALAVALTAQSPVVSYRSHTEIAATLRDKLKATPAPDLVDAPVSAGDHYQVNVVHRTKAQGAIAHQVGTEIHSIMDGGGTLITGGTLIRPEGAGARAPGRIDGGVRQHVQKGDVAVVPPQTPHWYEQIDGTITYLEIRFDVGAPVNQPALFLSNLDLRKVLTERMGAANAPMMVTSPVTSAPKYQANIVHRTKPQGVAQHELGTEVHQIIEGSGTFVTGGTVVRPAAGAPGLTIISGGESRHVQAGDVLFVPANVPHWYKDLDGGQISYLEVRFELPGK